jgi:hypothetical protein
MKPIIIENSKIPAILSYVSPINIHAIALFPFVFCRHTIDERVRTHETIHFQQQLETGVIFFYLIYLWDYLASKLKGLSGFEAYRAIRAEREAYDNQDDPDYLNKRKRWKWISE